ncbi:MAG: quinone-dependent dihydroorotate dehydrogenase, partial [Bacteroidetes bacterium]|nr:quinone-dependent dihydroorotate dehydrogenase [Bacteroidota bacterium]
GTVTPLPQEGNPKPRLFRVKQDNALINRMGFNNSGIEAITSRLRRKKTKLIIGGNIGKNKLTPNEDAVSDYEICFEKLFPYVDYFAVNVSSPNTPGLRDLQEKAPLTALLNRLQELNSAKDKRKPILLKIAPDLTNAQLDDIITIVADTKIDGVIATNTTIDRNGLKTDKNKLKAIGNGGLSGKPVKSRSTEVIKYLADTSNKAFPIIGVGGIHSPEDALEKLDAGATLVQLYTGFIYEGPALIKRINKAILQR